MNHINGICLLIILISLLCFTTNNYSLNKNQQKINDSSSKQPDTTFTKLDSTLQIKHSEQPQNINSYLKMGKSYFQKGSIDTAESYLKMVKSINDTISETYNLLGQIQLKRGKFVLIPIEAILSLLRLDHHSRAIRYFNRALKLQPDYTEVKYFLGIAYLGKGGINNLNKAEEIFSNLKDYKDSFYQLACIYLNEEDYKQASKILHKIILSEKDVARAHIKLAELFFALDKYDATYLHYFQGIINLYW